MTSWTSLPTEEAFTTLRALGRVALTLICEHLVQSVKPVPPHFFFEVTQNRTTPFWKHKQLVAVDLDGDGMDEITNNDSGSERNGQDL